MCAASQLIWNVLKQKYYIQYMRSWLEITWGTGGFACLAPAKAVHLLLWVCAYLVWSNNLKEKAKHFCYCVFEHIMTIIVNKIFIVRVENELRNPVLQIRMKLPGDESIFLGQSQWSHHRAFWLFLCLCMCVCFLFSFLSKIPIVGLQKKKKSLISADHWREREIMVLSFARSAYEWKHLLCIF